MPLMPHSMRHRLIDDEFPGLSSRPGKCGGAVFRASCKWGKNVRLRNPSRVFLFRAGTEAAAKTPRFNFHCWRHYRPVCAPRSSERRIRRCPGRPGHFTCPHRFVRPPHGTALLGLASREPEGRRRRCRCVTGPLHRWCCRPAACCKRGPQGGLLGEHCQGDAGEGGPDSNTQGVAVVRACSHRAGNR